MPRPLQQAASVNLPSAGLLQSALPALEQLAANNLGGTTFGNQVAGLFNQAVAGGATAAAYVQGTTSLLTQ